jgi:hypothetical protein
MFEQMFNIVNQISAKLDKYASGVRLKTVMVVMSFGKMLFSDNFTSTMASVGAKHVAPMFSLTNLGRGRFTATKAAAARLSLFGGSFLTSRRAIATIAPQQFAPVLLPLFCQFGGASRVCRRFIGRKSRNTVAVPVFAAAHFGGNFALLAHVFHVNYVSP